MTGSPTPFPWSRLVWALIPLVAGCAEPVRPVLQPPGSPASAKTEMLAAGAALLQSQAPLRPMDIYLPGFHVAKEHPSMQMEAHHFCRQANADFMQCALFDGNTAAANLIGIEYIVSEKLFESLPAAEKRFWHPHNYEILSGTLAAPGIPAAAEHSLMRSKINSYGKTWHLWNSAPHGQKGDELPLGNPVLEWSFNRDGEAAPGLVEERDRRMEISSEENRKARVDLAAEAHPQTGVDALKGRFKRPLKALPGVVDKRAAARPVSP